MTGVTQDVTGERKGRQMRTTRHWFTYKNDLLGEAIIEEEVEYAQAAHAQQLAEELNQPGVWAFLADWFKRY